MEVSYFYRLSLFPDGLIIKLTGNIVSLTDSVRGDDALVFIGITQMADDSVDFQSQSGRDVGTDTFFGGPPH